MTHHARLNLIMAATIAGLMLFLYFRPQSPDSPEYSIASSPAESVQNLRIVKQQQEIVLKQKNGHWHLIKPVQAWADEEKVAKILEVLRAKSRQRLPLADLGRFGLERPHVQLYIDDAYFGFGGFAPTADQQYVAAGDHVYMISPRYALALPRDASDLIDHRLLAPGEIPLMFELPYFKVEFRNERWHMTTQRPDEAIAEETLMPWIQLWKTVHAPELVLPEALGSDFVVAGLMKIGLQNGQQVNLKILQNEVAMVLLRENEGIGYQFSLDAGRRLLNPGPLKLEPVKPED